MTVEGKRNAVKPCQPASIMILLFLTNSRPLYHRLHDLIREPVGISPDGLNRERLYRRWPDAFFLERFPIQGMIIVVARRGLQHLQKQSIAKTKNIDENLKYAKRSLHRRNGSLSIRQQSSIEWSYIEGPFRPAVFAPFLIAKETIMLPSDCLSKGNGSSTYYGSCKSKLDPTTVSSLDLFDTCDQTSLLFRSGASTIRRKFREPFFSIGSTEQVDAKTYPKWTSHVVEIDYQWPAG